MEQISRPRLDDPVEFALIKEIYFDHNRPFNQSIDPLENLERMESRSRNNKKSSR